MLNIEKYKSDLIEIANSTDTYSETCMRWEIFCTRQGMEETNGDITADIIKWLCKEYEEPILGEAEKEYLSSVINPFKEKVEYIKKVPYYTNYEFIRIRVGYIRGEIYKYELINLPPFEENKMYKGMELCEEYSLKELGI